MSDAPRFDLDRSRSDVIGAHPDQDGTNFALFSENATRVELCLFDYLGKTELHRLPLPATEGGVWFGYLPGVKVGQVYGYRVHGPYAPAEGHRFNPNKLLIDPYARELRGAVEWNDALHGYTIGQDDLSFDERDSAPFMPKGVVVDPEFDWEADRALSTSWQKTFVYEAHVAGVTMQNDGVPTHERGTFAGLANDKFINHLKSIGVSALELLPVHAFANDRYLTEKNLSNYWGYSTLSFFAPHQPYLRTGQIQEFKEMVRAFHRAGIEVILDVVFNHTCEGSELGPTLSFRGIDNASYYLLSPEDRRRGYDTTGCGNTLNVAHPMVLRMVLDSLRYWVQAMHVDGFRFDLASTLGRESEGFERDGSFFNALRQDPVLSSIKVIAEPWDIGAGGYQVGGYRWPFREWNDKFRDDTRAFWRRQPGILPAIAERLTGSPVQFNHSNRPATSSVNFVAAHDGFTLWDTVSYNDKHNEANGEENRDGHDNNISDNMGTEGDTDDENILKARIRRVRAMLATVLLSQGVPMILAGDELGNTQNGNNNAYCQANEISWLDWSKQRSEISNAVAALAAFRQESQLSMPQFIGKHHEEVPMADAEWFHPSGADMSPEAWQDAELRCVGMRIKGGDKLTNVMIIVNAGEDGQFILPDGEWRLCIDTSRDDVTCDEIVSKTIPMPWQTVLALVPN